MAQDNASAAITGVKNFFFIILYFYGTMFFRLRRAEIASAVPGCSAENIITQRKFLRKFLRADVCRGNGIFLKFLFLS